ncbi:hypothetical protein LEP1GSC133_5204 [Leptospira borgpetersenii serovar Pomona str. 200901868]|uniref:Uncharacterized protein n=2 Tax=Leptospira borgpetersenii TaxID=174 RepID=A0A0S2IVU2_LEPBO|nr:hypothetical protein LBBP_03595 [Leptospira borgpetersenii serovar Ballum]EKQ99641.1 hypothetical protein LEP1GSC121_1721 [Leptospira borgpetersenii serovar Castellonis str. 200801910]EMK09286.1 hypothetical protein LEP1GSC066_3026 [Leptospira sp. serovar Kenya str. Sh9]EMO08761.1 hypothetical protein LEP1GSC137_1319 [Leptospira borgpetersenii str. Noumea 25]EMO60933.1 hypothetical protein LEP1GSC133_5204 [Leptospira borgpetersenii serovar Pomona str. 200901868]
MNFFFKFYLLNPRSRKIGFLSLTTRSYFSYILNAKYINFGIYF